MNDRKKNRKSPNVLHPEDIPSMVGSVDFELIGKHLENLPKNALILEYGPWLGGISARLAEHGELHVVDNFVWTPDHAKKVPDICEVGQSFRHLLESNLNNLGLKVFIHESDFNEFSWDGPPFDLVLIDGPKTPETSITLLKAISKHVSEQTIILFKNALNANYSGLVMTFKSLVDQRAIVETDISAHTKSNILSFRPGPEFNRLDNLPTRSPDQVAGALPQSGVAFHVVQLAQLLRAENWTGAYETLSAMPPDPAAIGQWSVVEQSLHQDGAWSERLETFCEIFAFHHGNAGTQPGAISMTRSPAHLLRAYWINNAKNPWRGSCFQPEILRRALEFGYVNWPSKIQDLVRDKDVIDVGCGSGIHGIGHLAAGARSYLGVDPALRMDKDRIKNLTRRSKEPLGWTPGELMALMESWRVDARPISEIPDGRNFDVAILYDVTEHLADPDATFKEIAERLRPGGTLIFVHHNFYSWNGHHLSPKTVADVDRDDPSQENLVDWNHVSFQPDPDHYISRSLNKIRLDDLLEITARYFDILEQEELPTRPENGADRLTSEIEHRYPHLTQRDFLTQNLHVIARVKANMSVMRPTPKNEPPSGRRSR